MSIDKLRREFDRKKRATEFIEGSPLDIADQLITTLSADLAAMTKERDLRNDLLHASNEELRRDLAAAREEARKWEWVAKEASRGRRTPDGPLLDTLLARYEEEGHWTA